MEIGKLPNDVLEKIVISKIKNKRKEVIERAGIGRDCAVIDYGENYCVMSSDPITGASSDIGKIAINVSCNDIGANGAEPVAVLMTILVPPDTTEDDIKKIMVEADEAAKDLNVEIVGGHTEITDAVNKTVLSVTAIGIKNSKAQNTEKVVEGDLVLMTKKAGLEGTAILALDLADKLKGKITDNEIDKAQKSIQNISVVKEGIISGKNGAKYMHDITEGGILGAAWEASETLRIGIAINEEQIPIALETKKICSIFNIDPLKLISSGSMLIIASKEKSNKIIELLNKEKIEVNIIGKVIRGESVIIKNGIKQLIDPPESDELYKVLK